MDRFYFADSTSGLPPFDFGEFQLQSQDGIRIYEGDQKVRKMKSKDKSANFYCVIHGFQIS